MSVSTLERPHSRVPQKPVFNVVRFQDVVAVQMNLPFVRNLASLIDEVDLDDDEKVLMAFKHALSRSLDRNRNI